MSLTKVNLREDALLHGCLPQALSKSEMSTGLKITKFDPTQVEKWGDEVVKYATLLGISPMLNGDTYPFTVSSDAKFSKVIETLQASDRVATTVNDVQGFATPASRPNPVGQRDEQSSPTRNLGEELRGRGRESEHQNATPRYASGYSQPFVQRHRYDSLSVDR